MKRTGNGMMRRGSWAPALLLALLLSGCDFVGGSSDDKVVVRPVPTPTPISIHLPAAANGDDGPSEPVSRNGDHPEEMINALPPTHAGTPPPPTDHAWRPFSDAGDEAEGYAMYTYVLFGAALDDSLPAPVLERYRAVLSAIIGETSTVEEALGTVTDEEERARRLAELNVFLIPAGRTPEYAGDLEAYDAPLARRYLSELARLQRRHGGEGRALLDSPGPFFVSVAWPLRRAAVAEGGYLLFADLSTLNPAAVRELVHAYKGWLIDPSRGEEERFASLRLKLLDALLDADDLLTLIRTAAADWRGVFGD